MKRITLRVYNQTLADALQAHFAERPDIPQNTLLCRLLERGLERTPTPDEMQEVLTKLENISTMLQEGWRTMPQEILAPTEEPQEAAIGLDAMLGGFESGKR